PHDTHDGPANDPTRFGPIITTDSEETHLPGFADAPPRARPPINAPASPPPTAAAPSAPAAPKREVPSPPPQVMIPPAPRVERPRMPAMDPAGSSRIGREVRSKDGSVPPTPLRAPQPARGASPSLVSAAAASAVSRPAVRAQQPSVAKNLLVLFALLAIAI